MNYGYSLRAKRPKVERRELVSDLSFESINSNEQDLGHSLSRNRVFPFGSYGKIVYLCTQQPIKQKGYETDDDDSQITDSNGNGVECDGLRSAV